MTKIKDTPSERFRRKKKRAPENDDRKNAAAKGTLGANVDNGRGRAKDGAREAASEEVLDLEGPWYDVLFACMKTLSPSGSACTKTSSRGEPPAEGSKEPSETESAGVPPVEDVEGDKEKAAGHLSTSRDETPFP